MRNDRSLDWLAVGPEVRFVWLIMIALADEDGVVRCGRPFIARHMGKPTQDALDAIAQIPGIKQRPCDNFHYTFEWELPPVINVESSKRNGRKPIPDDLRRWIFARDGDACLKCGAVDDLALDHIVPHVYGGPDTIDNLQTLCRSCNSEKTTHIIDYRK